MVVILKIISIFPLSSTEKFNVQDLTEHLQYFQPPETQLWPPLLSSVLAALRAYKMKT